MPIVVVAIFRSIIAFFVLLILARMIGKIQLSQLTFFEYIAGITIGSIAASMSVDTSIELTTGAAGLVVWAGLVLAADLLVLKSIPARKIFQGEPMIVIQNGRLMEDAMARSRYNVDELMMQLRGQMIFNLSDVQEAVLETNGKLSVLTKPAVSPVTKQDLNVDTAQVQAQPVVLIVDGNIAHHRLDQLGLSEEWLTEQIQKQGINDLGQVMVAQLGTSGELYVDARRDWEVDKIGMV